MDIEDVIRVTVEPRLITMSEIQRNLYTEWSEYDLEINLWDGILKLLL